MTKLERKSKKSNALAFTVKTEPLKEFFARGKRVALQLDKHEVIPFTRVISFEDTKDLIKFLTEARLNLLAAIRKTPASITRLASKLHRSRSAIDKDVQLLEAIGIVESEYVVNPGHGRCRIIKAVDAQPIKLQVETFI